MSDHTDPEILDLDDRIADLKAIETALDVARATIGWRRESHHPEVRDAADDAWDLLSDEIGDLVRAVARLEDERDRLLAEPPPQRLNAEQLVDLRK